MKVSVVTPTYNRASTLPKTIDSMISQTYDDFEYLIVDDGSTDNTESVVSEYDDDDRLRYIPLSENKGANTARNIGIKESSGEIISFLDSDDFFTDNKLTRIVNIIGEEANDCAGITHSFDLVDQAGHITQTSTIQERYVELSDLMSGNPIGGFSNIAIRAHIFDDVGYLDEEMPSYQDYEFFLRMLDSYKIRGIDETLTKKFASIPEESTERISDNLQTKIKGQKKLEEKHKSKLSDKVISEFYYTRGFLHMQNNDVKKAQGAFRDGISQYNRNPLYYYHYLTSLGGTAMFNFALSTKNKIKVLISRL